MQLKAINMDITSKHEESSNSLVVKKEGNNDMSCSMRIPERSSDYSLQSIQKIQSLSTNSNGMFGIYSPYQHQNHQLSVFGMELENQTRENVQSYNQQLFIKMDETDEVEEKFKHLSVNSRNELIGSEYFHNY